MQRGRAARQQRDPPNCKWRGAVQRSGNLTLLQPCSRVLAAPPRGAGAGRAAQRQPDSIAGDPTQLLAAGWCQQGGGQPEPIACLGRGRAKGAEKGEAQQAHLGIKYGPLLCPRVMVEISFLKQMSNSAVAPQLRRMVGKWLLGSWCHPLKSQMTATMRPHWWSKGV